MYLEAKIMVKLKGSTETIGIRRRKRTMPVTCPCQRDMVRDDASLRVRPSVNTSEPKLLHREPTWPHIAGPSPQGCASLRERQPQALASLSVRLCLTSLPGLSLRKS